MLADKKLLITGVITRDSIAWEVARQAQEAGAEVVLTGFGRAKRMTERAATKLPTPVERRRIRKQMQQRRHPPGEALRLPNPPETSLRITLQRRGRAGAVEHLDGARQHANVGEREIHPLGAGRRHDVGGVTGQE